MVKESMDQRVLGSESPGVKESQESNSEGPRSQRVHFYFIGSIRDPTSGGLKNIMIYEKLGCIIGGMVR